MKLNKDLIKRISESAKIKILDLDKYLKDFEEILDYFKILDECDVTNTKSSFKPVEEKNVLRDDIIQLSIKQEEALKFTKNKERGFFKGPKTI